MFEIENLNWFWHNVEYGASFEMNQEVKPQKEVEEAKEEDKVETTEQLENKLDESEAKIEEQ